VFAALIRVILPGAGHEFVNDVFKCLDGIRAVTRLVRASAH
jgi:hypothetical protein